MRAVLDTNILARAAASPSGPAGELLERISASHTLLVSSELMEELSDVVGREWVRRVNRLGEVDIAEFVGNIEAGAELVSLPAPLPRVVPGDPDDDLIVAIAVAGEPT